MIRVYCTDKGWLSSCNGTVVYYKNLQEAMDAAYRMERLKAAICTATTGDLQRAAMFLEGARKVRAGCTNQRAQARHAQATAWKKKTDSSITW